MNKLIIFVVLTVMSFAHADLSLTDHEASSLPTSFCEREEVLPDPTDTWERAECKQQCYDKCLTCLKHPRATGARCNGYAFLCTVYCPR